jgi:catechol 2,3-dioxygenase-like lactoylglutathione lyase family enzyme
MPSVVQIVPVLKVSDLQKAVDYYTGVLGFTVTWRAANDCGGENCMLHAGLASVLLSTGAHRGDKPRSTGTLYFHMGGVQAFLQHVKHHVEIGWLLQTTEYGETAVGILDCDGYVMAFAEATESESCAVA